MYNAEWRRRARERVVIEDRGDGTHLARTVGTLDPELIDAAIRVPDHLVGGMTRETGTTTGIAESLPSGRIEAMNAD